MQHLALLTTGVAFLVSKVFLIIGALSAGSRCSGSFLLLGKYRTLDDQWLLGGTFRFSFRFVGGRNPGPGSCSGWILAESGRTIPDVLPNLQTGTLLP